MTINPAMQTKAACEPIARGIPLEISRRMEHLVWTSRFVACLICCVGISGSEVTDKSTKAALNLPLTDMDVSTVLRIQRIASIDSSSKCGASAQKISCKGCTIH